MFLCFAIVAALLCSTTAAQPASLTPYTGTLNTVSAISGIIVDRACVDMRTAFDGADMLKNPRAHTVGCILMPPCIASGFCLMRIGAAGNWGCVYNFTTEQSAVLAKQVWSLTSTYYADKTDNEKKMQNDKDVIVAGKWVSATSFELLDNSATGQSLALNPQRVSGIPSTKAPTAKSFATARGVIAAVVVLALAAMA
jgi:hypothetical protein